MPKKQEQTSSLSHLFSIFATFYALEIKKYNTLKFKQ